MINSINIHTSSFSNETKEEISRIDKINLLDSGWDT